MQPQPHTTGLLNEPERSPSAAVRQARIRAGAVLACVVVGILLAQMGPDAAGGHAAVAFAFAALAGVLAMIWRGRAASVALAVGVVLLSVAWTSARLHTVDNESVLLRLPATDSPIPVRVRGVLTAAPEPSLATNDPFTPIRLGHTRLDIRLTAVLAGQGDQRAWEPVSGSIVVHGPIDDRFGEVHPGDTLELRGMLRIPTARLNPGEPRWLELARQGGAAGFLAVPQAELVERVKRTGGLGNALIAWRAQALGALRSRAARGVGLDQARRATDAADAADASDASDASEARSLLAALLLGIRSDPNEPLPTAMRRLGLAHLMAISGFHLALAAGFALFVLRAFRDLGRAEPLLLAALVVLYVAVLPVRTPVLRAAMLVLGLLVASGCGRRYDPRGVLCWIAIGLLAWRPLDVFSLGFQLSLGITALLLTIGRAGSLGVHHSPAQHVRAAAWWPVRAGRVCVECWAAGQPAVLAHFGTLSPLAWLATLVVVLPITGLLAVGYVALAVGGAWPTGGQAIMRWLEAPASRVVDLVAFMDTVPGAWFQLPLAPVWLAVLLTVAVIGVVVPQRGIRGERRRWPRWVALGLVVGLAGFVLLGQRPIGRGVLFRVDTVAVGSGSCHLVRSGREAILFDAGSMSEGVGRDLLPAVLRTLGVDRISTAIVTHPNLDHYNALPDLAESFGLKWVYLTEAFVAAAEEGGPESVFVRRMTEVGVELRSIKTGDSLTIGSARLDVLWPPAGLRGVSANDTSVMAMLHATSELGERRVLFTGDAGEIPLSTILDHAAFPEIHVMELPHHGSYNNVAERLVRTLNPMVVVQSTGPTRVADARWDEARLGRLWRTTAVDGCVTTTMHTDGHIRVQTER